MQTVPYYLELNTGLLTLGLGGQPAGPLVFTQGDVNGLQLGFSLNGADVGASLTGTGAATISWAIRASAGGTVLVSGSVSSGYWAAAPLATLPLNFSTSQLVAYFASNVPGASGRFILEIVVTLGGQQVAYFHDRCTIWQSIVGAGGGSSPFLTGGWVPAFTSAAGLIALPTVGLSMPLCLTGLINGALVTVSLNTGSTAGTGYYVPADNATSGLEWVVVGG